jgi:hypothetical protein
MRTGLRVASRKGVHSRKLLVNYGRQIPLVPRIQAHQHETLNFRKEVLRYRYISSDGENRFPSAGMYNSDALGIMEDPLVNVPLTFPADEAGPFCKGCL